MNEVDQNQRHRHAVAALILAILVLGVTVAYYLVSVSGGGSSGTSKPVSPSNEQILGAMNRPSGNRPFATRLTNDQLVAEMNKPSGAKANASTAGLSYQQIINIMNKPINSQ